MSMEYPVHIGIRLKAARERSELTQQELADALGLRHRQTVASIEAGERQASAQELIRAMEVLSVDLDYFTDPFRLVGEGQFSFRTSGEVEQGVLDRFEQLAGRWLAMYRELSREQGHSPSWLGYKLNLSASSSFEDAQAAGESAVKLWGPRGPSSSTVAIRDGRPTPRTGAVCRHSNRHIGSCFPCARAQLRARQS